jgi:hypothetical protein
VFNLEEPVAHRQELPADNGRGTFPQRQPGHAPVISDEMGVVAVAGGTDESRISSTTSLRAVPPSTGVRYGADDQLHPKTTTEDLGTQIIEGIQTEGQRHTVTWPVGAIGNDRPTTYTIETWNSPELKEVILRESDDPRNGESTDKLVNISRSEPDPSLFEPPPGYTVKDETGEFTIHWVAAR